ncbi:MAG: SDR family NAD(P)-dependent oxidoreductase [Hyphomicrobiales bacterium]|nr:SDR family NAD(P)-dependent oxidoreductase [Hyphomicrobiales bacterium]
MAPADASPAVLPVDGRVIAITGASRGLGAAIARRLHADGYTLALGVRDVAATRSRLDLAGRCTFHHFDALDAGSADVFIDEAIAAHGKLDGLINNAGVLRRFSFDHPDERALDEMWAVNVKAPFRTIVRALPALKASGHGRIVNIASTDAKRVRDPSAPLGYVMSKHALLALSHAAKFAGWEDGVRVTALCPGAIDTELIAGLPGATPAANRLKPETVAEAVSLLLRLPNAATVAEMVMNTRLEANF